MCRFSRSVLAVFGRRLALVLSGFTPLVTGLMLSGAASHAGIIISHGGYQAPASNRVDTQTHILPVYDAEALLKAIQPLLSSTESASHYQGKLIIRATPQRFDEIRQLIGQLDQAPQTLLIQLRSTGKYTDEGQQASGRLVISPNGRLSVNGQLERRQSQTGRYQHYQVRTLSGATASIDHGTLAALTDGYWGTVALIPLTSGLTVKAQPVASGQTSGGQYRIEISQQDYSGQAAGANFGQLAGMQHLTTQFIVRADEWTAIGQINLSQQRQSAGWYGTRSQIEQVTLPLEIKINRVR